MFSIIYLCYVTCHTQWAWVTYADTCTGCWAYVLWWLSCNLFHLWKRRKIRATLLNEVRLETPGADFVYTFQNPPSYSEFWPTVKLLFWTPGYNEFCKALVSSLTSFNKIARIFFRFHKWKRLHDNHQRMLYGHFVPSFHLMVSEVTSLPMQAKFLRQK